MKKKVIFATLVLSFIGLNVFFALNDVKNNEYLKLNTIFGVKLALADGEGGGGATFAKEWLTFQKLCVTSVFGSEAIAAHIQLDDVEKASWTAAIRAGISLVDKDCYEIICHADCGHVACEPYGPVKCASDGCPAVRTIYDPE